MRYEGQYGRRDIANMVSFNNYRWTFICAMGTLAGALITYPLVRYGGFRATLTRMQLWG